MATQTKETKIGGITFYQVNNDKYGNERHVVHFSNLLSEKDNDIDIPVEVRYRKAKRLANKLDGKVYTADWFGGGFVFTCHNLPKLVTLIQAELLKPFSLNKSKITLKVLRDQVCKISHFANTKKVGKGQFSISILNRKIDVEPIMIYIIGKNWKEKYSLRVGDNFFFKHGDNIMEAKLLRVNEDILDGRGQYIVYKIEDNTTMCVDWLWFRERMLIQVGIYGIGAKNRHIIGFYRSSILYFNSEIEMNDRIEKDFQEYIFHKGGIYLKK